MQAFLKQGRYGASSLFQDIDCNFSSFALGKAYYAPVLKHINTAQDSILLDLIHAAVFGPIQILSVGRLGYSIPIDEHINSSSDTLYIEHEGPKCFITRLSASHNDKLACLLKY